MHVLRNTIMYQKRKLQCCYWLPSIWRVSCYRRLDASLDFMPLQTLSRSFWLDFLMRKHSFYSVLRHASLSTGIIVLASSIPVPSLIRYITSTPALCCHDHWRHASYPEAIGFLTWNPMTLSTFLCLRLYESVPILSPTVDVSAITTAQADMPHCGNSLISSSCNPT